MKNLPALAIGDVLTPDQESLWRLGSQFSLFASVCPLLALGPEHPNPQVQAWSDIYEVRVARWSGEQWVDVREVGLTSRAALQLFRSEYGIPWKLGTITPATPLHIPGRIV